jgi:hypothetical protein
MKLKLIILYFVISTIMLSGCSFTDNLQYPRPKLQFDSTINLKSLTTMKLGTIEYIAEIQNIARKSGYKNALNTIMNDVGKYHYQLDNNDPQNNLRLYRLVSYLVYKIGYVDMKTHYFRNYLNVAPKTLEQMVRLNSILPSEKRWRLYSFAASIYHLQNAGGEYNLKFVSADGFCEAVYNKKGILLTEKNDPVNMGTFNYSAGIRHYNAHFKYDIYPYLKWGNTANSPQNGAIEIRKGIAMAMKVYNQHAFSVQLYRKKILGEMDNQGSKKALLTLPNKYLQFFETILHFV